MDSTFNSNDIHNLHILLSSPPPLPTCDLVSDQEWMRCDSGIIWETYIMPRLHPLLLGKRSAWWWLSTFLDVLSICTINQSNGWCHTCTHQLFQNQYILLTQNNWEITQWPSDLFPCERERTRLGRRKSKGRSPKGQWRNSTCTTVVFIY